MFDFTKITETLSSLTGGDTANETLLHGETLQQIIEGAGLDLNMLQGLAPDELAGLLADHGLDPSQFSSDQLSELAQTAGVPQPIAEFASTWFSSGR